ncbi:unnamed protein product [Ectocarpus fasciculatus]
MFCYLLFAAPGARDREAFVSARAPRPWELRVQSYHRNSEGVVLLLVRLTRFPSSLPAPRTCSGRCFLRFRKGGRRSESRLYSSSSFCSPSYCVFSKHVSSECALQHPSSHVPLSHVSTNALSSIHLAIYLFPTSQKQPEEDLHSVGRILVGSIPGGVSSIGSDTTYDEFCKRCGSTSSFGVNSERLLKLAVHEALELQTPQSQPFSTSGQIQVHTKTMLPRMSSMLSLAGVRLPSPMADTGPSPPARRIQTVHVHTWHLATNTTTAVRQMLSTERDLSIHVRKLVEFVQNKDEPALQFDSARLLGNISASHTHVVVKNGAVPIFVRLLTSANDDIREEAVRALGRIAGNSPSSRDIVLQRGAMGLLLQQLTDRSRPSMLRIATWALKKICGKISPPRLEQVSPALPTLARLIRSVDEQVLRNACAALRYLCALDFSGTHSERVQAVVGAGVCQRLVELLEHASPAVQMQALCAIDKIVSSEDQHKQVINRTFERAAG